MTARQGCASNLWRTPRGRRCVGYLPYEGDGRLLDFGCGIGRYVARMAAAGWKAEGIDLVPEAVAAGRKAGLTIHEGTLFGMVHRRRG